MKHADGSVAGHQDTCEAPSVKSVGLFHDLPVELQDSLVVTSKSHAPESRQKFNESLRRQQERRYEKQVAARDKKLQGEMAQVMTNSYLWQKYDSPRCCKTAKEAFDVFNDLNSKSAKLQFAKSKY